MQHVDVLRHAAVEIPKGEGGSSDKANPDNSTVSSQLSD
jgi:hypothetical protein